MDDSHAEHPLTLSLMMEMWISKCPDCKAEPRSLFRFEADENSWIWLCAKCIEDHMMKVAAATKKSA